MSATKTDLITAAYEEMRISGITVDPSSSDYALALSRLENMMAQLADRNLCVGYNFEDTPVLTSLHNVERKYWHAIHMLLADRLLPSFGKVATLEFIRNRSAAQAFLSSSCSIMKAVPYPSRMPIGSASAFGSPPSAAYYAQDSSAPADCATNTMYIGSIDNFAEHFDAYLDSGETVSSYVLTASTGLTIVSESLSTPDVNYQVSAVGNNGAEEMLQVKIVATTSAGRVATRIINFNLISADIVA